MAIQFAPLAAKFAKTQAVKTVTDKNRRKPLIIIICVIVALFILVTAIVQYIITNPLKMLWELGLGSVKQIILDIRENCGINDYITVGGQTIHVYSNNLEEIWVSDGDTPPPGYFYKYTFVKGGTKVLVDDFDPYTRSSDGSFYEIPPDALTDAKFAAMVAEAEKYIGYPYVWGGGSPETSFDCSGYISWVFNHSGWNLGRLTAQGLYNRSVRILPGNAKPGDLVFFTKTYASPSPVSHVGIYVGNEMMLHCGNPIGYTSVNTSYWTSHFYAYGRLY